MDRYTNEAARALVDYFTDDETPEHVQQRMRDLEKLCFDLVTMIDAAGWPANREPLEARARALLDLDPPGVDPF